MWRLSRWVMGALVALPFALGAWVALDPVRQAVGTPAAAAMMAAGAYGIHALLGAAEDRGWIYYRKGRGADGRFSVASEFLNMYDPSRRHLQETVRKQEWQRDEDDQGGDPKP